MKDLSPIPNSKIVEATCEYVKGTQNREIILDRYIELLTFEQLAEKYDLSVSTVKRIVYKYGDKVLIEAEKSKMNRKMAIDELVNSHFFVYDIKNDVRK